MPVTHLMLIWSLQNLKTSLSITINSNLTFKCVTIPYNSSTQNYILKLHFTYGDAFSKFLRPALLSGNSFPNNLSLKMTHILTLTSSVPGNTNEKANHFH